MKESINMWAIIDLFGHQKIAGRVTEAEIGGCSFIRVDVPEVLGESQPVTHFYGNGAIYSMTPVSEELVRLFVAHHKPEPISVYIPEIRKLKDKNEREDQEDPDYERD